MSKTIKNEITGLISISRYVMAGRAGFRISNDRTGKSRVFRITKAPKRGQKDGEAYFVTTIREESGKSLYMGTIFKGGAFVITEKAKPNFDESSLEVISFRWFWKIIMGQTAFPQNIHITHFGRCGKCNRPLKDEMSIEHGLGNYCYRTLTKVKTSA
jgi:hypothetical protein